jgi:hypothetical protein
VFIDQSDNEIVILLTQGVGHIVRQLLGRKEVNAISIKTQSK